MQGFETLEEEKGNYEFSDFTSLECWKTASALRQEISKFCHSLPESEKRRLSDQMIRASRSVTNNIAEGFGRYHYKETIKFMFQSRGSIFELKDHLIIARDEGYLSNDKYEELQSLIISGSKLLNGYIKYLIGLAKKFDKKDYMK